MIDCKYIPNRCCRFRGQEDCNTPHCPFQGQKTTHFHCSRSGCQFTFKNKADMEKHKNFHMKDEQLNKDGFKKFMKNDPCGFAGCRYDFSCLYVSNRLEIYYEIVLAFSFLNILIISSLGSPKR